MRANILRVEAVTPTAWWKKYRLIKPGTLCDCSEPATRWRTGEFICERCWELQGTTTAFIPSLRLHDPAPEPAVAEPAPRRFRCRIEFSGGELVICGHGEYRMAV